MKKKKLKRLIRETIKEFLETPLKTYDRVLDGMKSAPGYPDYEKAIVREMTDNEYKEMCSRTGTTPNQTLYDLAKENTQKMTDREYKEAWLEAYEGAKGKEKAPSVKPTAEPETILNPSPGKILSKMFPNSMVTKEAVRKPNNSGLCRIEQITPAKQVQIITTISGEDNEQVKENEQEFSQEDPQIKKRDHKFQEGFEKECVSGVESTTRTRRFARKARQV